MPKPSTRDDLLAEGARVMQERGYHATSVADIAAAAGAPKGSFYNHFESKEAFAVEILRLYVEAFGELLTATLGQSKTPPAERFRRLIDALIEQFSTNGWAGCLLGNLALDGSAESDVIRKAVNGYFDQLRSTLRDSFAEGQASGVIRADLAPDDAAGWFVSAWEGAVMRSRAERAPTALQEFKRSATILFAT